MSKSGKLYFIIIFTTIFSVGGFLCALLGGYVRFWDIGMKEISALLLFIIVLVYMKNDCKKISFLIPFVCIAFPTPISHFFPGINEQQGENGILYPFMNHVEFFFLYIILRQKAYRKRIPRIAFFLCLGVLFSFFINLFNCRDLQEVGILTTGLFSVRILVLLCLIVENINFDVGQFLKGLCYTILFLFVESTLNTIIAHLPVLTSGSLGTNTFGNVCGQLACMLFFACFFCKKKINNPKLVYASLLIGFIIVLASETRMAILASLSVFTFILYPSLSFKKKTLIVLIIGTILYFKLDTLYLLMEESGKYDLGAIYEMVKEKGDVVRSSSTSSLLTRFELWESAFNMIQQRPLFGVGINMFDNLKDEFGFDVDVVIDPHNGYFYLLSGLGVLFGICFIYFLYLRPWILYRESSNVYVQLFCMFNMGMSFCEFTNAGVYKYQVYSLLVFCSLYSYKLNTSCGHLYNPLVAGAPFRHRV